jgi:hypothetical protein
LLTLGRHVTERSVVFAMRHHHSKPSNFTKSPILHRYDPYGLAFLSRSCCRCRIITFVNVNVVILPVLRLFRLDFSADCSLLGPLGCTTYPMLVGCCLSLDGCTVYPMLAGCVPIFLAKHQSILPIAVAVVVVNYSEPPCCRRRRRRCRRCPPTAPLCRFVYRVVILSILSRLVACPFALLFAHGLAILPIVFACAPNSLVVVVVVVILGLSGVRP